MINLNTKNMTTKTTSRRVRTIIGDRMKKKIGALGERLVVKHLVNKGFVHVESNYLKKQGELDVIMENNGKIHFIEVKTVSRVNFQPGFMNNAKDTADPAKNVNRETSEYRPEDNVSRSKLRKLSRMVEIYLIERGLEDKDWQFDVALVYLDQKNKKAYIKFIKDLPLAG